jgi:hypothetical protein
LRVIDLIIIDDRRGGYCVFAKIAAARLDGDKLSVVK